MVGDGNGFEDKLSVVPLAPKPSEMETMAALTERNLPILLAAQGNIAKIRRAAFLAYVEAGFSEAQALELCCK